MSTLTICVWSALHLDVQKGKSRKMRYLTKARWLLVGIFCPELLLITAFNQLVEAVHLTIDGRILLDGDEDSYHSISWVYRWLARDKVSTQMSLSLKELLTVRKSQYGRLSQGTTPSDAGHTRT